MATLVSLVMSDIVDSTRRWAADEPAMAADLETHDGLVRHAVVGAGGSVFKHTGDGMIAVFADPAAAVLAAAAIQRSIGSSPWRHAAGLRVRVAVHTGIVYPRDGDLYGTTVNKVARLLGVCPAGAVLVSDAAAGVLGEGAPAGLGLRRLGAVELAGFATPEVAHALVGADLATVDHIGGEAPAVRSRLPVVHDELVGRTDDLTAIWDALGRARLVTLVGVGGMGKTRLALEVAAGAAESLADGSWWIDLSSAGSDDAVTAVAMAAVGTHEVPGRTPLESFTDRFRGVTGLVVVDNCEHVLRGARALIDALRTEAPGVHVVATSREALGLRGEQLVPIGSLPVGEGARLFEARARSARPDLDATAAMAVIERICARLDGIPLAIELAAARCRSMSPDEIESRLDDRFRLLRGGRESAERHRTLQAAVAWSYSMLEPDERTVFDRMAVFAGGTLLDGLAAVADADEFDVLDVLDRLIARSMVVATATPLGTRYHQLETLRQYAEDRLFDAGSLGDACDRHAEWVEALVARLGAARGLDAEAAAFIRFVAERDNLRIAVARAVGEGRHAAAQRMVAGLRAFAYDTWTAEVFDWVRPLVVDDGWTADAATCAARGLTIDFFRGVDVSLLRSVDAVPEWYEAAPNPDRVAYLAAQLQLGAPWRVAVELLDRCTSPDALDRMHVLGCRAFASYVRQVDEDMTAAEVDEVVAESAELRRLADQAPTQHARAVALFYAAWGLAGFRPDDAVACGLEAHDIATRLGAGRLGFSSLAAVGYASGLTDPSLDLLVAVRRHMAEALAANLIQPAGVLAMGVVTGLVARSEPDLALRNVIIWRREFGRDHRRFLTRVGLTLPDDVTEIERATAEVTLSDLVRDSLAALDRLIAERSVTPLSG